MKKKILPIIFCFIALLNYAQNDPWVFVMDEVPVMTHPKKLLKTKDNCFVSVGVKNLTDIFVYKVSMQGELVWKSCMQDTTSKYSIFDMLELPDSSILCVGQHKTNSIPSSYPYVLQLNANGEFIKEITFDSLSSGGFNLVDYYFNSNNIEVHFISATSEYKVFTLNLETETLIPRSKIEYTSMIKFEDESILVSTSFGNFFKLNNQFDTVQFQHHNLSFIERLYYDSNSELIYGIGIDSDSANYWGGVFVLNKNLEYLRYYPFDTLCPQKGGGSINDILINQAGNLVLAGSVIFMDEEHASIYINDINTGHPVAGHIFYESLAQNSYRVVALDYGYALLQYAMKGQQSRKYIVRVSANGDFDAVPENKLNASDELQIYPNPASSHIRLQFKEPKQGHLSIFNMQGVKVSETELDLNQQHFIDTSNLPNGNYMLQFIDNKNTALSNTFTISK